MANIFNSLVGGGNSFVPTADYATLMGTAMESLNSANSAMQELTSSEYKFEQVNKLADILDVIPSASMEHLALIENSMESLIGDNSVEVGDVLGVSLESVEGRQVSTERLRQMAKSAWEWIKEQLKKIRKAISDFFHSLFGATTRLRRAAHALTKRAQSMSGKSCSETKLDITGEASALADKDGKLPTSPDTFINYHGKWVDVLTEMNVNYFDVLKKIGDDLRVKMDEFDTDKPAESLAAINAVFSTHELNDSLAAAFGNKYDTCTPDASENRWPNKTVTAYPLLGSQIIVHIAPKKPTKSAGDKLSPTEEAEFTRGHQFAVSTIKAKMPETLKEGKVTTWNIEHCTEFASKVIELCDAIDEYKRKGWLEKLKTAEEKLLTASDKLGKKESSFKKDTAAEGEPSQSETKTMMRSALKYNTAYTNWINYPHTPAIKSLMASMRACFSVANKSLSLYK